MLSWGSFNSLSAVIYQAIMELKRNKQSLLVEDWKKRPYRAREDDPEVVSVLTV